MGETEDALAPSKKRAAGRELNRDKLDIDEEEDSSELETGTFKRATEEVLATRRIVKVRRNNNSAMAAASQPSKNPFAGICLVPPCPDSTKEGQVTASEVEGTEQPESETKDLETEAATKDEKIAGNDKNATEKIEVDKTQEGEIGSVIEKAEGTKENEQTESQCKEVEAECPSEKVEVSHKAELMESETKEVGAESAAQEKSTDNNGSGKKGEALEAGDEKAESDVQKGEEDTDSGAGGASLSTFQQLSSTKNAFTGLAGTGFSSSTFSFGSIPKGGSASSLFGSNSDQPSFNFGLAGNGNSSVFGSSGASLFPKAEGSKFPSKEEIVVETGEENERVAFSADSVLFEFIDGNWKERGKGETKVNVSTTGTEKARIIMRTKGNLRLVLNASLYPEIKLTSMEKRGVTFACVNSIGEGKNSLCTFALKFRDATIVESFREAVEVHKARGGHTLKTPENSPGATE
ncbi:hypothetical protein SAY87_002110 [Trapa incisa]|uniref:RanBD1 domain-containing protein n=1 Tax=Trapa incisa TaxID=236973 RepID=A0AAN7PUA2_9MYRT|nr:hypothetical protein SAY87_002110 [Trapa incisa]